MISSKIGQYISFEDIDMNSEDSGVTFDETKNIEQWETQLIPNETVQLGVEFMRAYDTYTVTDIVQCLEPTLTDEQGVFKWDKTQMKQFLVYVEQDSTVLPYILGASVLALSTQLNLSPHLCINKFKAAVNKAQLLDHVGVKKKPKNNIQNIEFTKQVYKFFSMLLVNGKVNREKRMNGILNNFNSLQARDQGVKMPDIPHFINPTGVEVMNVCELFYTGLSQDFTLLHTHHAGRHMHGVTPGVWVLNSAGLLWEREVNKSLQDTILEQIASLMRIQGVAVDQMLKQYGSVHRFPVLEVIYAPERSTYVLSCGYSQHKGGVFEIPLFHTKLTEKLLPTFLNIGSDEEGTVFFDAMYGVVEERKIWNDSFVQQLGPMQYHQQARKDLSAQMNSLLEVQWNVQQEIEYKNISDSLIRILEAHDLHESDHLRDIMLLRYVIKKELGNNNSPYPEQRRIIALPGETDHVENHHNMFACWYSAQPGVVEDEQTNVWSTTIGKTHTCVIYQDGNKVKFSLYRSDETDAHVLIPLISLDICFPKGDDGMVLQSSVSSFWKEQQVVLSELIEVEEGQYTGSINDNNISLQSLGVRGKEITYQDYVQGRQFLRFMQSLSSVSRNEDILDLCRFFHLAATSQAQGLKKKIPGEEAFPLICPGAIIAGPDSETDSESAVSNFYRLTQKAIQEVYKGGSVARLLTAQNVSSILYPYISRTQVTKLLDTIDIERGEKMRNELRLLANGLVKEGKTNVSGYTLLIKRIREELENDCRARIASRAVNIEQICISKPNQPSPFIDAGQMHSNLQEIQIHANTLIDSSQLDLSAIYALFRDVKEKIAIFGVVTEHVNQSIDGGTGIKTEDAKKEAKQRQDFYKDQFKKLSDQQEEIMLMTTDTLSLFQKTNYLFDKEYTLKEDMYSDSNQLSAKIKQLVNQFIYTNESSQVVVDQIYATLIRLIAGCEEKEWKPRDIKVKLEQAVALIFRQAIYDKLISMENAINGNKLFQSIRSTAKIRVADAKIRTHVIKHQNREEVRLLRKDIYTFKETVARELGLDEVKSMRSTIRKRIQKRLGNLPLKKTALIQCINKIVRKIDTQELEELEVIKRLRLQNSYFRECRDAMHEYTFYLDSLYEINTLFLEEVESTLGKRLFASFLEGEYIKNICNQNLHLIAEYRKALSEESTLLKGYIARCNEVEGPIRSIEMKQLAILLEKTSASKKTAPKKTPETKKKRAQRPEKKDYKEELFLLTQSAQQILDECAYSFEYGKIMGMQCTELFDATQPLVPLVVQCLSVLTDEKNIMEEKVKNTVHDEFYAREQLLRLPEQEAASDFAEISTLERQLRTFSFDETFINDLLQQIAVSIQYNERPLPHHPHIIHEDEGIDMNEKNNRSKNLTELLSLVQEYQRYAKLHKSESKEIGEKKISEIITSWYLCVLAGVKEKEYIDSCLQTLGKILYLKSRGTIDKIRQKDDVDIRFTLYQSDLMMSFLQKVTSEEEKRGIFYKLMNFKPFDGQKKIDSFLMFPVLKEGKADTNRFFELVENCGLVAYVFEKKNHPLVHDLFRQFPNLLVMIQKYIEIYSKQLHQKKVTDFLHAKVR